VPQEARLISAKEGQAGNNKLYYIDYAVRRPEDTEERMFVSAVSLGFNGRQVSWTAIRHELSERTICPACVAHTSGIVPSCAELCARVVP